MQLEQTLLEIIEGIYKRMTLPSSRAEIMDALDGIYRYAYKRPMPPVIMVRDPFEAAMLIYDIEQKKVEIPEYMGSPITYQAYLNALNIRPVTTMDDFMRMGDREKRRVMSSVHIGLAPWTVDSSIEVSCNLRYLEKIGNKLNPEEVAQIKVLEHISFFIDIGDLVVVADKAVSYHARQERSSIQWEYIKLDYNENGKVVNSRFYR